MENKDGILRIIKKYVYVCRQEENKHLAFRRISTKSIKKILKNQLNFWRVNK